VEPEARRGPFGYIPGQDATGGRGLRFRFGFFFNHRRRRSAAMPRGMRRSRFLRAVRRGRDNGQGIVLPGDEGPADDRHSRRDKDDDTHHDDQNAQPAIEPQDRFYFLIRYIHVSPPQTPRPRH
jgi:hypothetical protein